MFQIGNRGSSKKVANRCRYQRAGKRTVQNARPKLSLLGKRLIDVKRIKVTK